MTTSPIPNAPSRVLEQHAERAALAVVRGANFTQSLTINGIIPSLDVSTPKGKSLTFHGLLCPPVNYTTVSFYEK
jgi:hypothetical protein